MTRPGAPKSGECDERNAWNPAGSDIGRHEWPFPIIYITDANTTKELVEDCYEKYNKPEEDGSPRHWPLCAVELDSFMNQAVNSEVCMRYGHYIFFLILILVFFKCKKNYFNATENKTFGNTY